MSDKAAEPEPENQPPFLANENPYSPVSTEPSPDIAQAVAAAPLPASYWVLLAALMIACMLLCYATLGLGVPALCATIAAAIRVPLVRQRQLRIDTSVQLLPATAMLLTSWFISLALGIVSVVLFCIVCIPTSLLTLSGGGLHGQYNNDMLVGIVFGGSGLIALSFFVFLYVLSLKLPW